MSHTTDTDEPADPGQDRLALCLAAARSREGPPRTPPKYGNEPETSR